MSRCNRAGARSLIAAAALSTLGAIAGNAKAASIIWDGGGGDSNWGTAANWGSLTDPNANTLPAGTDSAVFTRNSNITFQQDIDTGTNRSLRGINIGNGDATSGYVYNFSISNNSLSLIGATTGVNANVPPGQTGNINGATVLQVKAQTLTGVPVAGQAGTYTINSNVVLSVPGSGTDPNVYNGSGNASVIFNGLISTAPSTRGGFRVDGGGTVVLTNPGNSYTGLTSVVAGTLITRVSAANGGGPTVFGTATSAIRLGDAADTGVNANIQLLASDSAVVARNISVISTPATNGTVSIGGGTQGLTPSTFSGTVTIARSINLRSNGNGPNTVDFTGQITGTGNVSKTQPGTVRLSNAANNYVGTTTLAAGTLLLGAPGVIPDASNLIFNGGTLSTAGLDETAGTLALSANSAINFGGAGTLSLADSSAVTWAPGATLQLLNWNGLLDQGGTTHFFVGSSPTLLTKLDAISFIDPVGYDPGTYAAKQLPSGEVVPVPEPTSLAMIAAFAAPALLRRRRAASSR